MTSRLAHSLKSKCKRTHRMLFQYPDTRVTPQPMINTNHR
nr:MAG TPA: hypothetical protein [Caudoviricetes sp.]